MPKTHNPNDTSLVIHSVPVFQKDLAAVFKLLADRNPDSDVPRAGNGSTAAQDETWSHAKLVALFGMCKTVHRAILTRIAEAGAVQKAATYEELRAAGAIASENKSFDFDNMRGNLAWISKYMIKVTGSKTGLFAFSDKGADFETGARYEYRMSKAIADAWLQIAKAT